VFVEPINIRAENVERIAQQADDLGIKLNTEVFASRENWKAYAISALQMAESIAAETGLGARVHLWPDQRLGSAWVTNSIPNPALYRSWLDKWWGRISEWPNIGPSNRAIDQAPVK